jgi:hypothetical protein
MDALEYEKARIRMCRTMVLEKGGCEACPLYNVLKRKCGFAASIISNSDIDTIKNNVDRVIKWAKDHPVKTRNFAVESFRALIKAEPTVTPSPVYAKRVLLDREVRYDLQNAFPKAFLNLRLELIAYPARNTTVPLYGADTLDELNARIIEWCSREACKSNSPASMKYHLNGINQFCHTDFTRDGMEYIYTNLGNGINHDLCLRFVGEMDFNLNKLKRAIAQREGK